MRRQAITERVTGFIGSCGVGFAPFTIGSFFWSGHEGAMVFIAFCWFVALEMIMFKGFDRWRIACVCMLITIPSATAWVFL